MLLQICSLKTPDLAPYQNIINNIRNLVIVNTNLQLPDSQGYPGPNSGYTVSCVGGRPSALQVDLRARDNEFMPQSKWCLIHLANLV